MRTSLLSHASAAATLACHGEDADHKADAPVAQERHLRLVPVALFGFPLGLDGGPDADPEDQQVEEDHDSHPGDVESHGGRGMGRARREQPGWCSVRASVRPGGSWSRGGAWNCSTSQPVGEAWTPTREGGKSQAI